RWTPRTSSAPSGAIFAARASSCRGRPEFPMNFHGTAFIRGDKGVVVRGRSGAGKTTLALSLIGMYAARGRFAMLVADDQVFRKAHGRRLVCAVPETIAGLAEFRGIGPGRTAFEP